VAQQSSQQKRLISERVRALAIMYLTRRSDLVVREETTDVGIDLLVSVHPEEKEGLRQFGVELRGSWSAATAESANAGLYTSMQSMRRYGPFPFPVVLLLFTMQDNQGWYTWAAEPMISSQGNPKLTQHGEAHCRPLDERAVGGLVERVNRWYDAFFAKTSKTDRFNGKGKGANK
jgi:Domain of unknown function (DUF4365)